MNMLAKRFLSGVLCGALLFACSGCVSAPADGPQDPLPSEEQKLELLTVYGGETVDLCPPLLRQYLEEDDFDAQCAFLLEHEGENFDYQNISFAWEEDGSELYSVYFSKDASFTHSYVVQTEENSLAGGFFAAGQTYYWKVESEFANSETDHFYTDDEPGGFLQIDSIANVRDIGGWSTESGGTVRRGMVYRGSQLNGYDGAPPLSERGVQQLRDVLGVVGEIDLRTAGVDDADQTKNYLCAEAPYLKAAFHPYTHLIPQYEKFDPHRHFDDRVPAAFRSIFAFLSDESNYPLYMHCNAGADRTGTLAFILNGLLGVSYEDLTKDFEITSFTVMGNRWRGSAEGGFTDGVMSDDYEHTYVAWGKMYELFMEYYATSSGLLSDAIENWLLTACGVPQTQIDKFCQIMLTEEIV